MLSYKATIQISCTARDSSGSVMFYLCCLKVIKLFSIKLKSNAEKWLMYELQLPLSKGKEALGFWFVNPIYSSGSKYTTEAV